MSGKPVAKGIAEELTTEYLDLYYMKAFDTGFPIDIDEVLETLFRSFNGYLEVSILKYTPLLQLDSYTRKGWTVTANIGTWIRPVCKVSDMSSIDMMLNLKYRAIIDAVLISEEFLGKNEFARLVMGPVIIDLSASKIKKLREIRQLRGYFTLLLHQNGVMVLTLRIPVHGIQLSSRDVMYLRYVLEIRGAPMKIPRDLYNLWIYLRKGTPYTLGMSKGYVKLELKITDLLDIFALAIKFIIQSMKGSKPSSLIELESRLRNPWDTSYTVLFTEVLKGEKRFVEVLREYSAQIYAMLRGPRRLISKNVARRVVSKSFRYIPLIQSSSSSSRALIGSQRLVGSSVSVIIGQSDTHIVSVSRRYLGPSDIGERIRALHITVLEFINHARQCLKIFQHIFTTQRPRNLEELTSFREWFSKTIDYIENSYFIVDTDMKDLFRYGCKVLELDKAIASSERKFESLSFVIMTRYQERISKMQVLLSVLFGAFGIPFFLFSYFEWLFDVALEGKSRFPLEITVLTFLPMLPIILTTIYLYFKWRKEIFK